MRIRIFIIFIALLGVTAGNNAAVNQAGQETPFSVGVGARALGMGGGFTSLANDASAIYYNPAGLASLQWQEFSAMHMTLFEGTIYDFGGWVYPDSKFGGVGIGYMRIGTDNIIRRNDYTENGSFGYSNSQFILSYGKNLQGSISAGLNFKIVNQSLDNLSDYGFGFDIGMMAHYRKRVNFGLLLRNMVPPELTLKNASETTPISIVGGLAVHDLSLSRSDKLTASLDLEKIENRKVMVHTGVEITLQNNYLLRAGYDRDNFSFGAGLKLERFRLDYAYKMLNYIEDSHRFSLSILIGKSINQQMAEREKAEQAKGSILLEDERRKQFDFYKKKADEFYNRFRLDSALVYYQRALAFKEHDAEITGTIAAIENSINFQQEKQRRIIEAQRELDKSIQAYLSQAENFFAKKYYRAALDMLDLIFDINPNHEAANELKRQIEDAMSKDIAVELENARQSEKEGNYIAAIEAYNRVLDLDPGNTEVLAMRAKVAKNLDIAQQINKGIEQYNNGKYDKSKATFSAVLSVDNNNPVALDYLKRIAVTEEKTTTLEDLQQDKDVWALYLDGLRYMRNHEYQKAIDAWNKVLKSYPNNINTLNNIEQAKLRLKSEESK
jgi:tetratricopeptide (TPR) repeat protein